jgi:hypothetical protein
MKPPDPPFVEINVHDVERSESELLQRVLDALVRRGASSNGVADVHEIDGPDTALDNSYSLTTNRVEVALHGLDDVAGRVGHSRRVVEVEVAGVFRYDRGHYARVTYVWMNPKWVGLDNHSVTIWASGEAFSGPSQEGTPKVGREIREVFEAVIDATRPSYGSITCEGELLGPNNMAATTDYGSYFCSDFYLSERYVGSDELARVEVAARGLTVLRSAGGLFVYSYMGLKKPNTEDERDPAAKAFVRSIARRAGNGPSQPSTSAF